jgi:transcriptional regulator GlxA family with amidase domain
MKRIFFVLLPRVHMLDLGGPLQILGTLPELGLAELRIQCVGPVAQIRSFQGPTVGDIAPLPARLSDGDVVVVVGSKIGSNQPPSPEWQTVRQWLSAVGRDLRPGILIASICTGALLLAEAGLLDGRLCTTHHDYLKRLQRLAPQAQVLKNRMLVQDGPICTSAGVSAGIDLALYLIGRYFGAAVSVRVARENLVEFRRLEGDPQLDSQIRYRNHHHALVHAVQDFLIQQPDRMPLCDALADRFAVSYRHLARLFQEQCGIGLKQYQQALRLDRARKLLEETDWPIERVAERSGFSSMQSFRAAWRQRGEKPSPSQWRALKRLEKST